MPVIRILGCIALLVWLADLSRRGFLSVNARSFAGAMYPAYVAAIAFALLAVHVVANVWRRAPVGAAADPLMPRTTSGRLRFMAFVGIWLIYVLALPEFGFVLSTSVAAIVSTLALGRFHPGKVVAATVFFVVLLKVLFITVFYISLPEGVIDEFIIELVFRLTS